MASEADCRPLGVFECQLCALTAPYSYVGQKPPNTQSVVNAAYSTPGDSASLVSRRTLVISLRKFSETWQQGQLPPRGPPASPDCGPEYSSLPSRDGAQLGAACLGFPCTTASSTYSLEGWGNRLRGGPKARPLSWSSRAALRAKTWSKGGEASFKFTSEEP
ncbi:cysteine-rich DPF motif domain-containing protein 1 isoform X2 [Castor canadensis]